MELTGQNNFNISNLLSELLITQAKVEALTSIIQNEDNKLKIKLALRPKFIEVIREFDAKYPNVIQDLDKAISDIIDLD
jgi:hypothetical protein